MTRSTNMEHVEVLRDLSEVCRAAIKAGDWRVDGACDPDSLLRHADAALASLSAPQPPAEAQPVAAAPGGLLPCPFCGADSADTGGLLPWVECTDCDASGPSCGTEEEAVAAWNRRTQPPSTPVGVECAPIRYFVYDSDCGDYNEFDTLPEAIADAQEALDCAGDDGWPEGGPSIYYGAVLGEAREVEGSRRPAGPGDHPDADFIVEYELKGSDALSQQPAAPDISSGHYGDSSGHMQPAAVDGDNPYPAPRNRQEAAALARLALAYLGVTSAHIDAVVARCETDLAGQQGGYNNGR